MPESASGGGCFPKRNKKSKSKKKFKKKIFKKMLGDTPPSDQTPRSRHPPEQTHPPGTDPSPWSRHPPWEQTPRADSPLCTHAFYGVFTLIETEIETKTNKHNGFGSQWNRYLSRCNVNTNTCYYRTYIYRSRYWCLYWSRPF